MVSARLAFWPLLVFEIVDKGRGALLVAVACFPSVDSVPQYVFQGMRSQGKRYRCFNGTSYVLFWAQGESGGPACWSLNWFLPHSLPLGSYIFQPQDKGILGVNDFLADYSFGSRDEEIPHQWENGNAKCSIV